MLSSRGQRRILQSTVAVIGIAVVASSCSRPGRAPKLGTITILKSVQRAIQVLEEINHSNIAQQFLAVSAGRSPQEKWELLLRNNALSLGISDIEFFCRDAWKRRFNVDVKTNLPAHADPGLVNSTFGLVVWSSGANGVNEFGGGDDVVLPLPTETILKSVERAIEFLEETNRLTIAQQFLATSAGTNPKDKWKALLSNNGHVLGTTNIEFFCRDAERMRFNVNLKTNLPPHAASQLLNSRFGVVIWSSGANGKNDFGNGDDVLAPQEATKY